MASPLPPGGGAPLKRRIGTALLTAYGVGVMVGAGIYVLTGAAAGAVPPQLDEADRWLARLRAGETPAGEIP